MKHEQTVRLTTVGDVVAARVLAAQLEDAGFQVLLRGEFAGPYPMTVGRMAETEIWIAMSDLEEAQLVLADIEDSPEPVEHLRLGPSPNPLRSVGWWIVAVLLLTAVLYVRVWRLL